MFNSITSKNNDIKKNKQLQKEEIDYLKDKLKKTEREMSIWSSQCLETEDNNNKLISSKIRERDILQNKLNNPTAEKEVGPEIFYEDLKTAYKTLSSHKDKPGITFTIRDLSGLDVKF